MESDFNFATNTTVAPDYGAGMQSVNVAVDSGSGIALAVLGGMFLFVMFMTLVFYVYLAFSLMRIAKKAKKPNTWFAWIPILNIILMLQIANKPIWWLFLFIIPGINIVFTILIWMEIAKAVGKPEWWGILIVVPFVNIVVPGYLAFSDDQIAGNDSGTKANEMPNEQNKQKEIETEPKAKD